MEKVQDSISESLFNSTGDGLKPQKIKITKIVANNFLSFDYEEIILHPKFTIAYGPNGAGKSSIYQSIKFALGSNNYDGRYTKWSEFIRDGENAAYVELFIDVDGKKYGIKRRVHRKSSPSFYFKQPGEEEFKRSTSSKIVKFVDEIGISPENIFCFMSQGNIDKIKDFDEKTLCDFIEGGIGLSTLRKRILDQKNKVEELKRDHEALEARKKNLQFQILSLKPKIRKLKEKLKLEKEVEGLKNELLWVQRKNILKKIHKYEKKIKDNQNKINETQQKILKIEKEIKDFELDLGEKKSNNEDLFEEISEKKAEKGVIENKVKKYNQEKNDIGKKINESKEKIHEKREEVQAFQIEYDKLEEKIKKIQKSIDSSENSIETLENEQQEIIKKSQKYQDLILDLEKKKQLKESLQTKKKENEKKHKGYEEKINNKLADIKKIRHELEDYKWFMKNPSEDLKEKYEKASKKYRNTINILEDDLDHLQDKYTQITKKMDEVKKSVYSKDMPKPKSIQKMMQTIRERNMHHKCVGPLIDYISFNDIFQQAIKSIFGYHVLYSFIARNNEAFYRLKRIAQDCGARINIYMERNRKVRKLSEPKNAGQQGILGYLVNKIRILHKDPAIEKVVHSRAKNTLVVKDNVVGTNYIQKYNYKGWIVTLDGEQIRPKNLVIESRPFIKKKGSFSFSSVAETKQYLKKLEEEASKNRKLYNQRMEKKKNLEEKGKKIDKRLRSLGMLLNKFKKMEIHSNTKDSYIDKRESLYDEINAIEEELEKIEKDLENIKADLPKDIYQDQKRLNEIPEEIKAIKNDLEEFITTKENNNEQLQDVNNKLITAKTTLKFLEEKKTDLMSKLENMDSNFMKLINKNMKLTDEIEDLENELGAIKDEIKEIEDEKKEKVKEKEQLSLELYKIQTDTQNFRDYIQEKEGKLERIRKKIQEADNKKKLKSERSLEEIQEEIDKKNKELQEYRDVDRSLFKKRDELKETIKITSDKKSEILEEIEAAKNTEQNFEDKYYTKYSKSLVNLEKQINDKFTEAELGFSANIELQGGIKELGVAINTTFHTPSGEPVTRKLSGLSGGQRSMVGICLMLSLNQLNPSPFNIYDEIEMFLDPDNAQTVAKLIHNLTKNGYQFMILMPDKSKTLIQLADKVIGVCKNGKYGCSMVLNTKFTTEKSE